MIVHAAGLTHVIVPSRSVMTTPFAAERSAVAWTRSASGPRDVPRWSRMAQAT